MRLPVNLVLELLALVGLLLLNAFFVAAEYGLVTSRRTRIMELEHSGNRRARAVRRITSDPPRFISSMQLGVTISSLAIGALGEQVLSSRFDTVMASFLAVAPRAADRHVPPRRDRRARAEGDRAEQPGAYGAVRVRGRCACSSSTLRPLIWLLQARPRRSSRVLGQRPPGSEMEAHSEAELRMLLSTSADQGEIEHSEQQMLYKVFDFGDKEVSDVMVPRPEVVAISVNLPAEEALQAVLESPFTRYPVYGESLDDIVGVLHIRDLTRRCTIAGSPRSKIAELVRPCRWCPRRRTSPPCSRSSGARTSISPS